MEFQELQQVFSITQKDEEKKSDRGEWKQPPHQNRQYFTPQYKPQRRESREYSYFGNLPQSEQSIPRQHQSSSMSRHHNDYKSPRHPNDYQQQRYRQYTREALPRTRQSDRYQNERHQPRKRVFLFDKEGNLVCSITQQTDQEYEYESEVNQPTK